MSMSVCLPASLQFCHSSLGGANARLARLSVAQENKKPQVKRSVQRLSRGWGGLALQGKCGLQNLKYRSHFRATA